MEPFATQCGENRREETARFHPGSGRNSAVECLVLKIRDTEVRILPLAQCSYK